MRQIKYIVLHCTAGPQSQKVADIERYWKDVLKWKNKGYHHLIEADGTVHNLVPVEQVANGVGGYNANAIHISYIGGVDAKGKAFDNRTVAQKRAMLSLVEQYKKQFPNAVVLGHRDFSTDKNGNGILEEWEWMKYCPCFDVRDWLKSLGKELSVKPSGIIYKLNYPLIKDSKVNAIQEALNGFGYRLKPDGVFGQATHDALVSFQTKNGIPADGIVGPNTASKLNIKL